MLLFLDRRRCSLIISNRRLNLSVVSLLLLALTILFPEDEDDNIKGNDFTDDGDPTEDCLAGDPPNDNDEGESL